MRYTTFNTAGSNRSTTGDRKYVFDREKERLVVFTGRSRNILVDSVHEFEYAFAFGSSKDFSIGSTAGGLFQSLQSGTFDDRRIVAGEVVFVQEFANFHFNEFQKFGIVELVDLVQEYYDVRNADLTSEKDVFSRLGHRTVGSGNDKDSAVHLRSAGYHVLNVVGVARAVNVSIVTFVGLVFNVSGVDRNTSCFLFRRFIDFVVFHLRSLTFASHYHRDSGGQSGFTMVDVTDSSYVDVRFASVKF